MAESVGNIIPGNQKKKVIIVLVITASTPSVPQLLFTKKKTIYQMRYQT